MPVRGAAKEGQAWTDDLVLPFCSQRKEHSKRARYHFRGNWALTCVNVGGRYWDRTSDLSGVNGRVGRALASEYAADLQGSGAVECG